MANPQNLSATSGALDGLEQLNMSHTSSSRTSVGAATALCITSHSRLVQCVFDGC